jgi:cysteine desulfurase / selenocysteine lyase
MSAEWDLARLRAETAGCEQTIFFNNAGASLQPRPVVARVIDHLQLEEQLGGYEAADRVSGELEALYSSVARLLNCAPDEVALQENATRGWEMAFYSLRFAPGDRIVTSASEYASNYIAFLQVAQRTGAEICVVESDESGELDLEALRGQLDDRVKLIALTHLPTNGGLVQPAARVGALARQAGIPFLLDATQSAGQIHLDVEALGCDMLCATGRKYLRGPRGTGFLYVRRSMLSQMDPPLLDLHAATWISRDKFVVRGDAKKFETWESAAAVRLGFGVAVEYALALGLRKIERRVQELAALLRERLAEVKGVTVHDLGRVRSGIVTFTCSGHSPVETMQWLHAQGIAVRVSERAATLIDMERRGLEELGRASVHYYNTEAEIERFCQAVRRWMLNV